MNIQGCILRDDALEGIVGGVNSELSQNASQEQAAKSDNAQQKSSDSGIFHLNTTK